MVSAQSLCILASMWENPSPRFHGTDTSSTEESTGKLSITNGVSALNLGSMGILEWEY